MPRPRGSTDASVTRILDAFRRLTRHLRQADRQTEQRLGISGAQLFTLEQLGQSPAQSVNELAELTRTHQSSVSVVASRLVERGLAARRQSDNDARRVELRITSAGQALLRRSPATPQSRMITALERMPPGSLASLAELLDNMVEEMGAGGVQPTMFFEDTKPRRKSPRRQRRRAAR